MWREGREEGAWGQDRKDDKRSEEEGEAMLDGEEAMEVDTGTVTDESLGALHEEGGGAEEEVEGWRGTDRQTDGGREGKVGRGRERERDGEGRREEEGEGRREGRKTERGRDHHRGFLGCVCMT